jgi:hypothetical protein
LAYLDVSIVPNVPGVKRILLVHGILMGSDCGIHSLRRTHKFKFITRSGFNVER